MGQASSTHIYVPIYIYVYTALDSQLEGSLWKQGSLEVLLILLIFLHTTPDSVL